MQLYRLNLHGLGTQNQVIRTSSTLEAVSLQDAQFRAIQCGHSFRMNHNYPEAPICVTLMRIECRLFMPIGNWVYMGGPYTTLKQFYDLTKLCNYPTCNINL